MNTIISTLSALLIGSVLVINGANINAEDILADAVSVVNEANVHQLATALEMYYLRNDSYPIASDGTTMINTLYNDGVVTRLPMDSSIFDYQSTDGQNYTLELK